MKKRLFSIFLTLALCIGLMPAMAFAESNTPTTGSGTETDPWVVYNWAALKEKMNAGGYIKLGENVTDPTKSSDSYLEVPSNVTVILDLNSHTIDRGLTSPTTNGYVIELYGILTIIDTSGNNGAITGGNQSGNGGGVYVGSGGTFDLRGGTISDNKAAGSYGGGGVYVGSGGTFTMSGSATISGNSVTGSNNGYDNGGGVYVNGTFNMTGGTIANNTTTGAGGGVMIVGAFNMSGGSITGNKASRGGGVWLSYGSMTLNGGSITGNTADAECGGVVITTQTTFNLSGNPIVTGNTIGSSESNLWLTGAGGSSYISDPMITVTGALTEGASIGVTLGSGRSSKVFTNGFSTYNGSDDPTTFFFSDDSAYVVAASGGEARLADPTPYNLYVAGTQVTSANASDLSVIDGVTVASGGEAKYDDATKTLTLNGATITNSNANPGTVFASNIGVFYADSEDLTVSLTGKNTITTAPITVTGGNVYSTNSGFHSQGQGTAVRFTGGGSLDVRSGESIADSYGESAAISVAGPVTIDAATTISATADNASRQCRGFYAYGMITVNGSLTAVGGNSQSSYGIYGQNNMTVAGSAVVNATAGNATANNGAQSCAISCHEYDYGLLTVSGTSKVTATSSKTETGQSYGIYAKQVIAKDSAQIKAVAGESVKTASSVTALSRGIDSSTLEISDNAAVIAIGGKVIGTNTEGSIGVWLSKKGSISGGSLTATGTGGDGSEYTRGLMTPSSSNYGLYVSGGEVKLTAEKTAKYAFGFVGGDFSITGGTVTATAGATEPPTEAATVNSAGIYANGTIDVSNDDAVVNATGLLAGIYSMGDVTISGGTVTAEGIGDATITDHGYNGIGIRTDSPAKITFSGDKTEISAKGKKTGVYSPSGITISSPLTIVSPAGGKMSMGNMQIANADGSNATDVLIKAPEIYAITIGAGLNMSLDSGEESQSVVSGNAITDVVYTAEEGYYFPTDYSTAPVNGIGVTRNSFTQITVSGTPTAKTSFYPADATAKTKPAEPSVAATDCTTESNNDGTITGVDATMEYQKSGDTAWIAITGSEVEGLVPGTYSVRVAETDTTLSSDAVSVTIAEYNAPPKVNAPVFTPASGKTFTDTLDVTISIPDNATVYYTRDKSEPSETNGIMTTGAAITLEETTTLKAIAISNDPNYGNSDVVTATYTKSSLSTGGGTTTYPVKPSSAENGNVTVAPRNAAENATVTITVTPDEGYVLDKLTVKDKDGKEIEVKDNGDGTYTFTMPASAIEIEATFKPDEGAAADDFPFVDVPENSYFRKPVEWAVEKGITNGVSEDKYGPEMSCTRAQVVTFLWITCGSEDASIETGFDDVDVAAYYDKAVAWAVEKGITAGTSENEFSPDVTITRAQFVTMLWAAKGMPEASGEMPFKDVPADAYYAKAVAWAYANDITAGKSADSFAPDDPCTRAQIMTFLYNAYAE